MSDDDVPKGWDFLAKHPDRKPSSDGTPRAYPPDSGRQPRERKPGKGNRRRRPDRKPLILKFVVVPGLILGLLGFIAFLGGLIYFHGQAKLYDLEKLKDVPERTLVYDRNGQLLGHVSGHGENRQIVPVSRVSQNFIKPLLAREDMRFYRHGGVDYFGVARAVLVNLKTGRLDQGASTLTMQLARNTFGLHDKSIFRKLREVALARRLERKLEKDQILEYYMNRIYFGSGLYGIERAAQGFFMKPAADLTLGEGAMLAGVIRGPSLLNPFRDVESAKNVRD